ncbi:hypothetical protein FNF31_05104 [Cafeteria roenbergensis]|uniref:AAA+ ATPase domain-containing protein n=1 Tax=Cafeteria roenbergensis TaxID=33653 RepID=A0A5A8D2B9_CAFRO|nr:hypothetical protein FNF31_05104 [Cafeteria roenbergensis]
MAEPPRRRWRADVGDVSGFATAPSKALRLPSLQLQADPFGAGGGAMPMPDRGVAMARSGSSLPPPLLSATPGSASSARFARSPTRAFPDPMAASHAGAAADLAARAFTSTSDTEQLTAVDRIGRLYTPTSAGLSFRALDSTTAWGGASLGRPAVGPAGTPFGAPSPAGQRSSQAFGSTGASAGSAVAGSALSAVRRGRTRAKLADTVSPASPAGHRQRIEEECEGKDEPWAAGGLPADRVAAAVDSYWVGVETIVPSERLAPLLEVWEDGVLSRLGVTEGAPRVWLAPRPGPASRFLPMSVAEGDALSASWVAAALWEQSLAVRGARPPPHLGTLSTSHLVVHAGSGAAVLATGSSPSNVVEACFDEMHADYYVAVKRAMLDYATRSADPRAHGGLDIEAVEAARWRPRGVRSREELGIDPVVVPAAGQRLSRRLFGCEELLLAVSDLFRDPVSGAERVRLVDATGLAFRSALPLSASDVQRTVADSVDAGRNQLRSRWHKECVEAVASFVVYAGRKPARGAGKRRARGRGARSSSGEEEEGKGADDVLDSLPPQEADRLRFAARVDAAHAMLALEHGRRMRTLQLAAEAEDMAAAAAHAAAVRTPRDLPPILGGPAAAAIASAAHVPGGSVAPTPLASLLATSASVVPADPDIDGDLPAETLQQLRVAGGQRAAAALMAVHLRETVFAGIESLQLLLDSYFPPEQASPRSLGAMASARSLSGAGSGAHGAPGPSPRAGAGSSGKMTEAASHADGVFDNEPAEELRCPLVRITLALDFIDGSAAEGRDVAPELVAANDKVQSALEAGREQAVKQHRAFMAKAGKPLPDPADTSDPHEHVDGVATGGITGAGPERRPAIDAVDLEGRVHRIGEEAWNMWAGTVRVVQDPSWDSVEAALVRCAQAVLEGGEGIARPEAEIAKYVTGDGAGGAEGADGGSADGDRQFDPDAARARVLASVAPSDERVVALRRTAADVVAANASGPERLRRRFQRFEALFSPAEKQRLVSFCLGRSNHVKHFLAELARLRRIDLAIQGTASDLETFRLVQVDCSAIKAALRARVRLHAAALGRTLKARTLSICATLNDRYEYLRKRLLFKPRDSEELVEHAAFVRSVPEELLELANRFNGPGGVSRALSVLYGEFALHEALPAMDGHTAALGPAEADGSGAPSRGGSRAAPGSRAGTASAPGTSAGAARRAASSADDLVTLNGSQLAVVKEALQWPVRIREARAVGQETLEAEKRGQLRKLEVHVSDFETTLAQCREKLDALRAEGALEKFAAALRVAKDVHATLEASLDRAEELNKEQELLELEPKDWATPIGEMLEELGPFERLWEGAAGFMEHQLDWYGKPLLEIDPEEADKNGEACKGAAVRSAKELPEDCEAPRAMANQIRAKAQHFLTTDLPLLVLLANPGLKRRHWEEMEESVGFKLPHNARTNLGDMLKLGLEERVANIEDTCVMASKEHSLEKALEKMQADWEPVELDLKSHKGTGTYILSGASVDEVQALLDDHIVKAQTMGASRFAQALIGRIKEWVDALTLIQNVLDGWVKVQTSWLYLEPIFSSDDIMQQMPEEGRRFRTVDTTWRDLMRGAVSDPAALRALRQEGMEERLRQANELLDLIGKGLNSYLETKRLYFPRFFFLSNDELLEILAETKDPTRVQPHLKKCFEGIQQLVFDDAVNILAMVSGESERVDLSSPHADGRVISPAESKGNVEVWLDWVENAMRRSVARSLDDALRAYPDAVRTEWMTEWPGQAVLAGSQTYWTHGVEKALREGGATGIREYGSVLRGYINDIIMLVRGDLPKLARRTLSALTVLEVHSRDVTLRMGDLGVDSEFDFEWNSQLRYYWKDDGVSRASGDPGSVKLRMINAQILYANEYLGNSGRLVITPLTDRCYRTLVGAVHLGYGGAPEGPAGTGKTETTKDLAKAAGMMCVVYNCSDQLGVQEMAKFFKGLASSGAWACFDEFNRIDLEVLSVVAQQIMDIQIAIRERKERFVFYGTEISLRWTANAFITMNPGYAGRSELPDNLKSLFRSVAMMVPDYAMIAEIILYSFGYLEAKDLARKIVATYRLCSEQLSSQFHYDYGMRAVMAVLRAAGNLKRDKANAALGEDVLVLRAIVDVNLPKFLSPDIPLFNGIARDLFPGVDVPPPDRDLFLGAMRRSCHDLGLQLEEVVQEKVIQLYEMMIVRHGFMLVGMPWSGKTAATQILAKSMRLLHDEHPDDPRWQPIHLVVLNPKSVTLGQLYGRTDPVTKEWTNGVLATHYRNCASGKVGEEEDRKWLVFDGPVDAIWIENMNTVLDDNKKLCLMSGEIIAMSSTMSMVFETKDLAAASPATVSRCGMVYLEPHVLGWRPIVVSWLDHLAEDNPKFPFRAARKSDAEAVKREAAEAKAAAEKAQTEGSIPVEDPRPFTLNAAQRGVLLQLIDYLVEPCFVLLRKELSEYCPTQDTSLAWQMTNVLETCLAQAVEAANPSSSAPPADGDDGAVPPGHYRIGKVDIPGRAEFSDADLRSALLFAITWSVGATMDSGSRAKLDEFVRGALTGPDFLLSHRLLTFFRVKKWKSPAEREAAAKEASAAAAAAAAGAGGGGGDGDGDDGDGSDAAAAAGKDRDPRDGFGLLRVDSDAIIPKDFVLPTPPPKGETIYDSVWCAGEAKWRTWESCLPSAAIAQGANFQDIVIPSVATLQFDHLIPMLLTRGRRVLACGPTGTGKSVLMKRLLLRTLPREQWMPIVIGFSAQTSALLTQNQVDRKMERRRKGVYGPRPGQTCVIFVDDLNMPQIEEYGAQPPIELLRQMTDSNGWYNLEDNTFMRLEDTLVAAAMGPPGGGRNAISPRMMRHLNVICFTEITPSTLQRIFSGIVSWFVKGGTSAKEPVPFPDDIGRLDKAVVAGTMDLYKRAQEHLRPTPAKTHYSFNLRDFARVVQGVLMATPDSCSGADAFTRLWIHESMRVFHDRLINDEDRSWVIGLLRELTSTHFGRDFNGILSHLPALNKRVVRAAVAAGRKAGGDGDDGGDDDKAAAEAAAAADDEDLPAGPPSDDDVRLLFWGDFLSESAKKPYVEAHEASVLVGQIRASLDEFNSQTKSPMDLVPFLFFLEHVSRIARVLKMPGGHSLLVGVGGSGRQCATKLATFMAGYKLIQIELSKSFGIPEWQDELKRIMREAGTGPQPVVFFFPDTQIKWQGMVEDINSILNSGEVPNLFAPDERAEIFEKVQPLARAAGLGKDLSPDQLYAYFVERLKTNLHIVLAMSPIGDAFRDRLRKFPSLVNCCTIDWFTSWPSDALEAVALKHVQETDLDAVTRRSVATICQHFHQSARSLTESFRSEARRHNYVTPTSYLELLGQFKRSLKAKRSQVSSERQRYVVGLEKLNDAATQVAGLQKQLEEMQPVLVQSQKDTAALMEEIQEKLPGVEEVRGRVSADAEVAAKEEAAVKAVADECEADLAEAMPALESAIRALNTLDEKDLKFVRSLSSPSSVIVMVLSAVLVMLGEKPDRIKDPADPTKKIDDFWGPAKKLLNNSKGFLARLMDFDRDNISPKSIGKVREQFLTNEDFNEDRAGQASIAAKGMCAWVVAMDKYERVAKVVAPKKAALAEAKGKLEVTQAKLAEKQAALKKVEDELGVLQSKYDAAVARKEELARETELCAKKLERAEQLITSLGGEKDRWTQRAEDLGRLLEALTGDVLLASGVVSYLGAFTIEFRGRCTDDWVRQCVQAGLPCSVPGAAEAVAAGTAASGAAAAAASAADGGAASDGPRLEFSLSSVLGNPINIQQWHIDGLPTDSFSTDNGVIVAESRRWPLMIDPQGQANKWVKNMEKDNNLVVLKQTDASFLRSMENAIQFGQPVLLENVGEELDPSLEPVLLKVLFKQGAQWCIRLGDATVEYDERFRLYVTTKYRNPHYLPETSTKVTLLNFMITPAGLQDQLLGVVVAAERPDLEKKRNELVVQSAANNRTLSELESRILRVLSESEGNILEDETAIQVLNESKRLANEIAEKQKAAAATEKEIEDTRAGYTPVASHTARLFFVTADMGNIDPMYQYSMTWFTNLFLASIRNSKKSDNLGARIQSLNDHFTYSLYKNVCRSLFERHKLLFSFLLCIRILQGRGEVDEAEWLFLLTGGVAMENPHPNPAPEWLTEKAWGELCRLESLSAFSGIRDHVAANASGWRAVYDAEAPHETDLPGEWGSLGRLSRLQRLLVLRTIRPDKVVLAVQKFVGAQMGEQFLKPPPFDLRGCHEDSNAGQPLIFVLSPGSDPMPALLTFAEASKAVVQQISLGQGQGKFAEEMIERGRSDGSWVVLQNCHLASSWMAALEKICEQLADAQAGKAGTEPPHAAFRLWLTSYPSGDFPVSILQNGIKMTNEPPKGLRANVERSYLSDPIADPKFFAGVKNAEPFRRLLFGLCFFHAMVQERRQFGPLGWNIPYEFTESDLRISVRQLAMFLDDPSYAPANPTITAVEAVPYVTLRYLIGECNYGGRVTDDKDRRALNSILDMCFCTEINNPEHALSPSGLWKTPPSSVREYRDFMAFIDSLPAVPAPEVFGLHANATITKDNKETADLFTDILLTQSTGGGGGGGSGGKTADETIAEVASDVQGKVRGEYDLEEVGAKFPVDWKESMNTVLRQELARFNRLLSVIQTSLTSVRKALKGLVVMSSTLEGVSRDMFFGRVPSLWLKASYPSLKPLGGFVADLTQRTDFLDEWIAKGTPKIFWLSGFYFTQSFLTGVMQNFARKETVPIDSVAFDAELLSRSRDSVRSAPEDGAFVWGLFLDGARWDMSRMRLAEQEPKQLFAPAPVMWMRPKRQEDLAEFQHYHCPTYKTTERRGMLSTTGHSTNFVMMVRLPTDKSEAHWIRRGVALILALDD